MSQILGVMLVKNEEHFIAWSLMNIVSFCDHVIVMDNCSTDRTYQIAECISTIHNNVEIIVVRNANDTQKFLVDYFGTQTWVLGVDGDEIHDPVALVNLKSRLQTGEFDNYWAISSLYCHVTNVDFDRFNVQGYSSPEAKAGLKLYNFNAIENWKSNWRRRERLHGPGKQFKPGYSAEHVYDFSTNENWNTADFRCLHLCFYPRTPKENDSFLTNGTTKRKNPAESKILRRVTRHIERLNPRSMDYRQKRYARGSIKSFEIGDFGKPNDFQFADEYCENVMSVLNNIHPDF